MVDWLQDAQSRIRVVEAICNGATVSLWARRGNNLDPLLGDAASVANAVRALWSNVRAALEEGRIVAREGVTVVPLRATRRLTGLLVVNGPLVQDDLSRAYLDLFVRRLGSQLDRPLSLRMPLAAAGHGQGAAPRGQAATWSRDGLLALLREARGNLTLVADWLGVSRQTMYNRLHAYGIPRSRRTRRGSPDND